ncbi:MAG: HD-GYP domain-containing protein [Oligoflexia bacterium]
MPLKILITFTDPAAIELLTLALEAKPDIAVVSVQKPDELLKLLSDPEPAGSEQTGFDAIFCDHPGRSGVIANALAKKGLRTPLVLFDDENAESQTLPEGTQVLEHLDWGNWQSRLEGLLTALSSQDESVVKASESEFNRIRPTLLLAANPLPADVYIRLSESKFLRLFLADDPFDEGDYEKYANQKKIPYFHLKKQGLSAFVERFESALKKQLAQGMSEPEATTFSEDIHRTVQELLKQGEVPPEAGELIKSNLQLTMHAIGSKPRLKDVLDRVLSRTSGYLGGHSVALCQVSCTIAAAMEWGSKATYAKLNFASFLHDCALDSEDLARIQSLSELESKKSSLNEQTYQRVLQHGLKAADMSKTFSEVPANVDQILLQHHERPDGSGFPRGLTHTSIAPLSALFIIAHDLVGEIFNKRGKFSYASFVESRQDLYRMGNFKKTLNAIARL